MNEQIDQSFFDYLFNREGLDLNLSNLSNRISCLTRGFAQLLQIVEEIQPKHTVRLLEPHSSLLLQTKT